MMCKISLTNLLSIKSIPFKPHNHTDRSQERNRNQSKPQSCSETCSGSHALGESSESFVLSWRMFIEHLLRAMLIAGDAAWIRKSFPGLKELVEQKPISQ